VGRVIGCSENFFMSSISVSIYRITYSILLLLKQWGVFVYTALTF